MNIGIIGLGLIGGSIGRALIKKTIHTVYGYDISNETMLKASFMSVIHAPLTDSDYALIDILIIALTPDAFIKVANESLHKLKKGAIIMDIAGNKKKIIEAMRQMSITHSELNFIGSHPMAGREFSGINHSSASLFEKASILLVPVSQDISKISLLKQLLLAIGFADVKITSEDVHDKTIAYTSQLAHIISSSYIKSPTARSHDGFSAGSFKDMSRVARLNPSMWTELLSDNSKNLISELDCFINNLNKYRDALSTENRALLYSLLEEGSCIKEHIDKCSREYKRNL
ncbi:MAG: prephenate dehydrogenase [Christensenellaceae bacterium]|jgi:prephenate dehydrogenase|nr:prephenate dehydrogenase [Christensenellaceae bacterium]